MIDSIANCNFYFTMKHLICVLILFCFGCTSKTKTLLVNVTLTNNNQSVKITGLDNEIMADINRDNTTGIWQTLFPVYRMPPDTDMKDFQRPQPGSYKATGTEIVFTPDTPFLKGQTYFLRYYQFGDGKSTWGLIKQKQKLGSQQYTDLTFKK
jgi:hypothetical protein